MFNFCLTPCITSENERNVFMCVIILLLLLFVAFLPIWIPLLGSTLCLSISHSLLPLTFSVLLILLFYISYLYISFSYEAIC